MKPISIGARMVAVTAAILITTGMAGGLAALAGHHADGRTHAGVKLARAGTGCEPVRRAQPDAIADYTKATGSQARAEAIARSS